MLLKLRRKKTNSGQSVVEYLLVFTAVVAAIIVFLSSGGPFRSGVQSIYENAVQYEGITN